MPGLAGWPSMSARKQDSTALNQQTGSTFWRQSSSAIPGRVNLKSGRVNAASAAPSQVVSAAATRGGGGAAHSFQHFQDSVSDAWEIEESPPAESGAASTNYNSSGAAATTHRSSGAAAAQTPARSGSEQNSLDGRKGNITPVHAHSQVTLLCTGYYIFCVPPVRN